MAVMEKLLGLKLPVYHIQINQIGCSRILAISPAIQLLCMVGRMEKKKKKKP